MKSEMRAINLIIEEVYYRQLSSTAILMSKLLVLGRLVGVSDLGEVQGCGIASQTSSVLAMTGTRARLRHLTGVV